MDIAPSGSVTIVFSGPFRFTKAKLGEWIAGDITTIQAAILELSSRGHFSVRSADDDRSALAIFRLAGTNDSPFPLELISALDIPPDLLRNEISQITKPFVRRSGPFTSAKVVAAVIRLFANGHGAVVISVQFSARRGIDTDTYLDSLATMFAFDRPLAVQLRASMNDLATRIVTRTCRDIAAVSRGPTVDGTVKFVTMFYVMSGEWDSRTHEELRLTPRLRPILQPQCSDTLRNQSSSCEEIVIYTSGFHVYVWNRTQSPDYWHRTIALVSFLNLINILWEELDFVKNEVIRMLSTKVPLNARSDLDEHLDVIYSQIMVSSTNWRMDFKSFRDEIDRRWGVHEFKDYCFSLIREFEARSSRRRQRFATWMLALIAVLQLISVIQDGHELTDRYATVWKLREAIQR